MDITESIQTEMALKESEDRLQFLFNQAPLGYQSLDIDGNFIEVNQQLLEILGYKREEVIGKWFGGFLTPNSQDRFRKRFLQFKEQGHIHSEYEMIHKNGNIIFIELDGRIRTNQKGKFIQTYSVLQDVTEKKKAEQKLKESEEKFRNIFEFSTIGKSLTTIDGNLSVNNAFSEMLGYSVNELLQLNWREITYKDDIENNEQIVNSILKGEKKAERWEKRFTHKNGSIVWADITTTLHRNAGKEPLFFITEVIDITARKRTESALIESQKLLKEITDNSTSLIYALDAEGCFTLINKSLEKVFGQNRNALIGKKREDFMPMEIAEIHHTNDLKVIETMQPITIEEESIESDGKHTYLSVKFPLVDLNANLVGVSGISTDITERKQSEERFIKLSRVNQVLSSVNQTIVHVEDQFELFNQVCKIAVEDGKLRMAWIGLINPQTNKVEIVASDGFVNGYLDTLDIDLNNPLRSNGPAGRSIKTGQHVYFNSIKTDDAMLPWRENASIRGYNSSISLPLFLAGKVIGCFTFYSEEENYFNPDEIELLDKLALNISFAMDFLENEKERKNAEDALRESKSVLDAALASTTDAIFITDAKGNYIQYNDAFEKIQKVLTHENLPNSYIHFEEIINAYNLNGEIIPADMWPIPRVLRGETASNIEYKLQRNDTNESWIISYSFSPILDVDGAIVGSVIVGRDVTDSKQAEIKLRDSEEKLSTLFASMTEMVALNELVFDESGKAVDYRISDCNNAFTVQTGYSKEEAIGRLASELYGTPTAPHLKEYAKVAQSGIPNELNTYFAPLDKYFLISVVSPAKNKFATIVNDITDIQNIQEEIKLKNKELENYIYVASHDLRSPLVNIQGFSQRLQHQTEEMKQAFDGLKLEKDVKQNLDKIVSEAIPKSLDYILSNATKMDVLIKGLLQVSRIGRVVMAIEAIDMNKLFKTILTHKNFELTEIGAEVIVGDLSECYGDENQLNQLFSNIIGNAIKYRDTQKKLKIKITSQEQYNKAVYSISDNGIGIAERNIEKIWNVFYRVDSSQPDSGEGIGLSLVKKITEKHKGKVWAESKEGIGTTINVELLKNKFEE